MARIKAGERFGDFVLENQEEIKVDTGRFPGKKILMSFHPLAWTSVCAKQMKALDGNYGVFTKLGAVPLGISVDTAPSKKAWAKSLAIKKLDLLSDFWPHGALAERLGLFIHKFGISQRANIILDGARKAVFVRVYPIHDLPDIKEVIDFLKKLI